MSMDLSVNIKDFTNITKEGCEKYLLQFGLKVLVHPEIDFETHTGFLPFKIEFPDVAKLKGKEFLTGFEFYTDEYDYTKRLDDIKALTAETNPPKRKGIMGLFNKKAPSNEIIHIINPKADERLKKCKYDVTLCFHEMHEGVIATAFAAYLAEMADGVIFDCCSGEFLYENINQKSHEDIKSFVSELELKSLHLFEKWL